MTQRYKITIAYDGTSYAGWQLQPKKRTIQGEVEKALFAVTREKSRVHGSGRTDGGVHAKAQVAHFDLAKPRDTFRLVNAVNAVLDRDIRVVRMTPVSSEFHARFSARAKEYRYFICNDRTVSPFERCYRAHIRQPLDVTAMTRAAKHLRGKHDFAAFSVNPRHKIDDTVRRISRLEIKKKGHTFCIIVVSDGFLYKMVRSVAGFLIRVGVGEVTPDTAKEVLISKKRTRSVPSAPPEGLFLWRVYY